MKIYFASTLMLATLSLHGRTLTSEVSFGLDPRGKFATRTESTTLFVANKLHKRDTIPGPKSDSVKSEVQNAKTFVVVEESAKYPGGISKFYDYIAKNLNLPATVKKSGVNLKVYVEFIVNMDGSIDDESVRALTAEELDKFRFQSNEQINKDCELEAVRLVRESPDWIPAKHKGSPVRQKFVIPINFRR